MEAIDADTAQPISSSLSRLPAQLGLLALAGWLGVLIGWAVLPPPATGGDLPRPPAAAPSANAPNGVAPRSLYPERYGSPSAITETVQVEGGYAVLRFEPIYRVVAVTNSKGGLP